MDKQCSVFRELNKIAWTFKDLINERNQYKLNSDNLSKNLEKVTTQVKDVTRECEVLRGTNHELKKIVIECLELFRSLSQSNIRLSGQFESSLETIKKAFLQTNKRNENLSRHVNDVSVEEGRQTSEVSPVRFKLNDEDIKKEIDSIKQLNILTEFYDDDEHYIKVNQWALNECNFESDAGSKPSGIESSDSVKIKKEPLIVNETEGFESLNCEINYGFCEDVPHLSQETTPKKEVSKVKQSPVFKTLVNRKPDVEDIESANSSWKLLNEKFLLKSADLLVSPLKRANSSSPKKEFSTPKRSKVKLNVNTPQKSPGRQLKKSNSREVDISASGVRKLTQTVLNIDCFKKKSPEKRKNWGNIENENGEGSREKSPTETKLPAEEDEDDVIMESPKKSEQVLEDIKNKKKNGQEFDKRSYQTPPEADLDETFVSSSILRKCQLTNKDLLERVMEDQTPTKRSAREKTSNYDAVPFKYKLEPVRKKADRMKLPGHACPECNKYYKEALGEDFNNCDLREMLNKCSRHRDNLSPSSEETPPGYWKPYLTCTIVSPNKDDDTVRR